MYERELNREIERNHEEEYKFERTLERSRVLMINGLSLLFLVLALKLALI